MLSAGSIPTANTNKSALCSKRIFSITAHIDHGKTTATDYLLRRAGLMRPEDAGQLQMTDSDLE